MLWEQITHPCIPILALYYVSRSSIIWPQWVVGLMLWKSNQLLHQTLDKAQKRLQKTSAAAVEQTICHLLFLYNFPIIDKAHNTLIPQPQWDSDALTVTVCITQITVVTVNTVVWKEVFFSSLNFNTLWLNLLWLWATITSIKSITWP